MRCQEAATSDFDGLFRHREDTGERINCTLRTWAAVEGPFPVGNWNMFV